MGKEDSSKQEDKFLIEKMRQGNEKSVENFLNKYKKNLLSFTRKRGIKDSQLAEDIVNDSIIKFWHNYVKNRMEYNFEKNDIFPYLCRVAQNLALKQFSRDKLYNFSIINIDDIYDEINALADESFDLNALQWDRMNEFMRDAKVFDEKCRRIYSLSYPGLDLESFQDVLSINEAEILSSDNSFNDIQIANIMNNWSGNTTEYTEGSIRAKRSRCKTSLSNALKNIGLA